MTRRPVLLLVVAVSVTLAISVYLYGWHTGQAGPSETSAGTPTARQKGERQAAGRLSDDDSEASAPVPATDDTAIAGDRRRPSPDAAPRPVPVPSAPKPAGAEQQRAALPNDPSRAEERRASESAVPVTLPAECVRPVGKAVEFERVLGEARSAASSVWKDSYCWFRRDARDRDCPGPAGGWRYRYSRLCS